MRAALHQASPRLELGRLKRCLPVNFGRSAFKAYVFFKDTCAKAQGDQIDNVCLRTRCRGMIGIANECAKRAGKLRDPPNAGRGEFRRKTLHAVHQDGVAPASRLRKLHRAGNFLEARPAGAEREGPPRTRAAFDHFGIQEI